ncbi:uncharacterized protein LOC120167070 [Hibiscus syriacus]|uniref:uncharacterized protein LOC120166989 n=1 Tax=Hibiscus syriacus TaxID=106335 RepID=UPI001923C38F|nr:uncharacterized protein LOC120166989 [Hibiscus syriacus]XP_039032126.1 uncharacterized protein LOC120167070 [Hibiscus syriacus]
MAVQVPSRRLFIEASGESPFSRSESQSSTLPLNRSSVIFRQLHLKMWTLRLPLLGEPFLETKARTGLQLLALFVPSIYVPSLLRRMLLDVLSYADLAEGLDAKQKAPVSLPMEIFKSYVLKEPIGVVGLITPWYYLLILLCFL